MVHQAQIVNVHIEAVRDPGSGDARLIVRQLPIIRS
jgi:hypothetical protein